LGFQADADPACEHVWSLGKGGALTATAQIKALKEEVDLVIVSLDWGIDDAHEGLARDLVHLGVDLIHGHGRPDLIGLEWIEGTPVLWGLGPYDNEALQLSLHWTDRGVQDLRLRQRGSSQRVEEFLSASRIPSGIKGV
jgi:poly-gamma-glutamate capsule biosynthesis protein CapA/YwtB (metallophosphatase superfamily)